MSRRAQENIVAGALLLIFVGYIALALGFGPNARLVPLPIATLGLCMLVVQLLRQNLREGQELHIDVFASLTGRVARSVTEEDAEREPEAGVEKELRAGGFVIAFVVLILLLGPLPAIFIFSTGYFVLTRHFSPARSVAVGAAFTAALYVLFVIGLQLCMLWCTRG